MEDETKQGQVIEDTRLDGMKRDFLNMVLKMSSRLQKMENENEDFRETLASDAALTNSRHGRDHSRCGHHGEHCCFA